MMANTWAVPGPHEPRVLTEEGLFELRLMNLYPNAADLLMTVDHLQERLKEANANAPWMTKAHALCTDLNIPPGNLEARMDALREYLGPVIATQPPKPGSDF